MNGNLKFHKPTGPAFNHGEKWINSGNASVYIDSVQHNNTEGNNCSDYTIRYFWYNSASGKKVFHEKDGWNFQVRYMHIADKIVLDGR
jgi:hypothetical protein